MRKLGKVRAVTDDAPVRVACAENDPRVALVFEMSPNEGGVDVEE